MWTRFHINGGKGLLPKRVNYFLASIKVTWTHSSSDTPQQQSISERNFRTMAERTLAMLCSLVCGRACGGRRMQRLGK